MQYQVNGTGFKFKRTGAVAVPEIVIGQKYNNVWRLRIKDNSFARSDKTHRVFLDDVRKRPDGSVQGYMVVETEPITRRGGSINVFVKPS